MMNLTFTKMHGLGNDFVVLDGIRQRLALTPQWVRALADRRLGVGCDQVLVLEPAQGDEDFVYRVFNADGTEVGQCGNGARCAARFLYEQGLTAERRLTLVTRDGRRLHAELEADGRVRVSLGTPVFLPARIPLLVERELPVYDLEVEGKVVQMGAVSLGNPHAVLQVKSVAQAPVATLGAQISHHPLFPEQANVGFMEVVTPGHLCLRVYERGVGETPACGSGAAAAVACGRRWGLLDVKVRVELTGGDLEVEWEGAEKPLWLSGPAVTVFVGQWHGAGGC